jgi:hypothetical protein
MWEDSSPPGNTIELEDVPEMGARSMRGESAWRRGVGGVVQAAHQSECLAQPTDVSFD